MVSERPADLESCRAAECIAYVLVNTEGDGGGGETEYTVLFSF